MTGRVVRIGGTVSPAGEGQVVQLQRRKSGAWVTLRSMRVDSDGPTAEYSFATTSKRSGIVRYRVYVPAFDGMPATRSAVMWVAYYRAAVTAVNAKRDLVKIRNTGRVPVDLGGWVLRNARNGKQVTLESMVVKPGRTVRVHSKAGRDDGNDMFLGVDPMWDRHGRAVLRDETRRLADRFRF
jgi:hypothetical protein